jgi:hypothetical protein
MTLPVTMEFLATLCSALFAGAAVYINVVEHPARMSCGVETALREWAPSYQRATWMQAPLAVLGSVCAIIAWLAGSNLLWLVGGLSLGLAVLFTLVVIMPTNRRLLGGIASNAGELAALLNRWNRLHAVRSALSVASLVLFLAAR